MKVGPDDAKILQRMAPGALSRDGFLGTDPRSPWEIVDADGRTVADMGLTHVQVAGRLAEILDKAMAGQGAPVTVADHLTAAYRESMGRIACPWGGCGVFSKGEVELTDASTGRIVRFTPLSVHMIATHEFYQGRNSRYRLDPGILEEMLRMIST